MFLISLYVLVVYENNKAHTICASTSEQKCLWNILQPSSSKGAPLYSQHEVSASLKLIWSDTSCANITRLNGCLTPSTHPTRPPTHTRRLPLPCVCLSNRKKEVVESDYLEPHQNVKVKQLALSWQAWALTHAHVCNHDLTDAHTPTFFHFSKSDWVWVWDKPHGYLLGWK